MSNGIVKYLKRILSIQSHVVSGYVGNKCCILPLQVLGYEVDFINSVQFSNHTGYETIKGQILNASDLRDLYMGLKCNNLANYFAIITGYIGSKTFLNEVATIIDEVKSSNSNALYYCDPVLGDNGKLYVPEELIEVYRSRMLPLADVIFPNQFEAELLTGISIKTEQDVIDSFDVFHKKGVKLVVITSTNLDCKVNLLAGYLSQMKDGSNTVLKFNMPKFDYTFVGTGDVFSALFLAWSLKEPNDVNLICSKVIGSMQRILLRTVKRYEELKLSGCKCEHFALELNIVGSVLDIIDPPLHDGSIILLK